MLENIKSKYILEIIFKNVHNRIKLKTIKYNTKILNILNITKEDFEVYNKLEEFYNIFDIYIEDIDIKELELVNTNMSNKELTYLNMIEFKDLEVLDLSKNKISNIKILKTLNLEYLKILDLHKNIRKC